MLIRVMCDVSNPLYGRQGATAVFDSQKGASSGITVMLDLFHFEETVRDVDIVITGEGRTDAQTAYGKTVAGVALRAKACGKTVVCLSGALGAGRERLFI